MIGRLLSDNKAVAAIWTTWTLGIITFAVVRVFEEPGDINMHTVGALVAVIGLPAAFIALYKYRKVSK